MVTNSRGGALTPHRRQNGKAGRRSLENSYAQLVSERNEAVNATTLNEPILIDSQEYISLD